MSESRPVLMPKHPRIVEVTAENFAQPRASSPSILDVFRRMHRPVHQSKQYTRAEQPGCRAAQRRIRQMWKAEGRS